MSKYKKAIKRMFYGLFKKVLNKRGQIEETTENLLIENTEECFIIVNRKLEIVTFNNKFEQEYAYYFGKKIEKGKCILTYAQPSKIEVVREIYQEVFKGEVMEAAIQVSMPNGSSYTFLNRYKPVYNKQKKITGAFVTIFNITTVHKAQLEILQSEEKYRLIIEGSLSAFFLTIPDVGIILEVNKAAIEMFGYTIEEFKMIGRQGIIDHTDSNFIKLLAERDEFSKVKGELTGLRKNGDRFPCEFSSAYYTTSNGEIRAFTFISDISARKLAEEEARKKELLFRSIIEYSHDILFLFDGEGKIEFLSPAIESIFGYKKEEYQTVSINILDRIHSDDMEIAVERLKLSYENPEIPIPIIIRNRKNDGSYLWLEGTITNMLGVPEVNLIVANFRDITERKIFEDQKALYVSIVNSSQDAILSKGLDFIITSWNRGAEKIFGYTAEEAIGKNGAIIIPDERLSEEVEIMEKIKGGEFVESFETQRKKKNGELIYISLTVSPIRDSKGNITGISKVARDISDKKASEDKIKNSEKRFRSLQQNSTDGLSLLAIDGTMLEISPAGRKVLGYEDEELIGKARFDLIHPDDVAIVSEGFAEVISDISKIGHFEYRSRMPDGSYKWLEASCQNLLQEPAVEALVVNYRDITERKNQEIEREQLISTLHQNNNDLRHFSYITSHNLKAPLSNLLGFIKLIEDIPVEDPMLNTVIEGFKTSTILLNETINDLVKILIIRDSTSIELKETSFEKIFAQVCAQLQNLILEFDPEINTNFSNVSKVTFNETYLGSIFLNLLTNAIKYRSYERKLVIDISTTEVNNEIFLTFSDNGIGLDVERHKSKIFGLYQRFHDRPNSKGLGLYLIKSQMESLQGSIDIDSKVDSGTTFTLKFKKL